MEYWWLVILIIIIVILVVRIFLMKKSVREISRGFGEKLGSDTNTLIDISSSDTDICNLADALNTELSRMRELQLKYERGDLELKGAVTNISHDLRTPLTAIISYLELLENNPQKLDEYLPIIEERAEDLSRLAEELFCYSVITSPDYDCYLEPVLLNEVLEESVLGFYAELSGRGITPEINITKNRIVRDLNRSALSRILANIIGNVVKYSDGDLYVELDDNGVINFCNTAAKLNGVDVGRLFDRFYTLENARKSTGLGLSIARTLVGQMGGDISAFYEDKKLTVRVEFGK